uniref:Uncharacterized protein n=1 Tax=Trichinella nativa TaxID=6335 RepID=A0A0V1KIY1_9BILA
MSLYKNRVKAKDKEIKIKEIQMHGTRKGHPE